MSLYLCPSLFLNVSLYQSVLPLCPPRAKHPRPHKPTQTQQEYKHLDHNEMQEIKRLHQVQTLIPKPEALNL
jgi:hypothetical protein